MSEEKAQPLEERPIHCDGQDYLVLKTPGSIRVLDARGELVARSPKNQFAVADSIFGADEAFWRDWIRRCRGEDL